MSLGVYIHIPFCRQKCLYCDFPSFANLEDLFTVYTDALCREISDQGAFFLNEVVDTVYIGGGTPTILPIHCLSKVVDTLTRKFSIAENAEISMEANPGTVDQETLFSLKNLGVNRISLGIQSFHNDLLKGLGRIHTSAEGIRTIREAHKAGFNNINIDVMFGLPGQTLTQFAQDLDTAAALGVQHISVYGLKIEAGTPFAKMYQDDKLSLPAEEQEEAMYDLVTNYLHGKGWGRYEISNYALQERQCRHNLKYWRYEPYLGMGSAAYSFIAGERRANYSDVQQYIQCLSSGVSQVGFKERVDSLTAMAEFMFLGLRTTSGVNIQQFNDYFAVEMISHYGNVFNELTAQDLIKLDKGRIYLTTKGMKFGNQVFEKFLPD